MTDVKLSELCSNTWNNITVCKQKSYDSFKNASYKLSFYKLYIYKYILSSRQTVSLYHNSSVWLDTLDTWSWDRNPPNFTLDLVSDRSANNRTSSAREL